MYKTEEGNNVLGGLILLYVDTLSFLFICLNFKKKNYMFL